MTAALAGFFRSGHAVDVVLAVVAAEFVVLVARRRKPPLEVALALAPGACLLLAVRAALTGTPWPWIALALAASFPFHLADLARRRM